MRIVPLYLWVALLLAAAPTLAGGINCRKAVTDVELLICANPTLLELDREITSAWQQRLATLKNPAAARQWRFEQRRWNDSRTADHETLQDTMQARLHYLRDGVPPVGDGADDAFAALLSIPQAAPLDGSWGVQAPPGFAAEDDAGLLAWLRQQKRVNNKAYRYDGTLLHHAIRAGFEKTAVWLLEQGADPNLRVLNMNGGASDALWLAIEYGRWSVFDALLQKPGLQRRVEHWKPALGSADAGASAHLLSSRFPLPQGQTGQCVLERALNGGLWQLALALPERQSLRLRRNQLADMAAPLGGFQFLCLDPEEDARYPASHPFSSYNPSELEAVDARLATPLLPWLLPSLGSPADVDRLFQLKLRQPFDDVRFTRRVVTSILGASLPKGVARSALERLPRAALGQALDDDEVLRRWFAWAHGRAPQGFAWALTIPAPSSMQTRSTAVFAGMLSIRQKWGHADAPARWVPLLQLLHTPLQAALPAELLEEVAPEGWPALFALGYHPTASEIANWLATAQLAQLTSAWPQLLALQPTLRDTAIASALSPVLAAHCSELLTARHVDKVMYLLQHGARVQKGLPLCASSRLQQPALYARLTEQGIVRPFVASRAGKARLVPTTLNCRLHLDAGLRKALLASASTAASNGDITLERVLAIDIPGEQDCALLLSGDSMSTYDAMVGEKDDPGSFTSGPMPSPRPSCPDPAYRYELWHMHQGRLQRQALENNDARLPDIQMPLRDTRSGKRYYLAAQYYSMCGQPSARLLTWGQKDGVPALREVPASDPVFVDLLEACAPDDETGCASLASHTVTPADNFPPWQERSIEEFLLLAPK